MKAVLLVAMMAAVLGVTASANAAAPQPWFWSKERAASVARMSDQPTGCSRAIYKTRWVGNCVSPNYTYGGPTCVGVGPRTISSTDDVYLYKKFTCRFATFAWTPTMLTTAYRQMAERGCEKQLSDAAAYDVCLQAALKDPIGAHRRLGGMSSPGLWLQEAATKGISTLRVQVTGRFTAIATWLGKSWKMTINPTG